jgi:hypothetical protein
MQGDQVDDDFQLLDPHDLMTAEIDDLRQLVLEKRAEAEERAGEAAGGWQELEMRHVWLRSGQM